MSKAPSPKADQLRAMREAKHLALMRSAKTSATYSHGMGGLPRKKNTMKPVTLPKLNCLTEAEPK